MLDIEWTLDHVAGRGHGETDGSPARIRRYRTAPGSNDTFSGEDLRTQGKMRTAEHWLTIWLVPDPAWDNDMLTSLANGFDVSDVGDIGNSLVKIFMREIGDDRIDGASPFELFVLTPEQNENLSRLGGIVRAGDVIEKDEIRAVGHVRFEPNLFEYRISGTDLYDRTNELLSAVCGHSYEATLWRENTESEDVGDRYCFDVDATTISAFRRECLDRMAGDTNYKEALRCVLDLAENMRGPNFIMEAPNMEGDDSNVGIQR